MSYSRQIKTDIDSFQASVIKLSMAVQSASSLWRDEQYSRLAHGISVIDNESKDVLLSGDRLCNSIDVFFSIAEEEYD